MRRQWKEKVTLACVWVSLCKRRLTLLNLQLAGLTGTAVAHLRAGVFSAVERGAALLVTLQHGSLAAAHRLTAAVTSYHPYTSSALMTNTLTCIAETWTAITSSCRTRRTLLRKRDTEDTVQGDTNWVKS